MLTIPDTEIGVPVIRLPKADQVIIKASIKHDDYIIIRTAKTPKKVTLIIDDITVKIDFSKGNVGIGTGDVIASYFLYYEDDGRYKLAPFGSYYEKVKELKKNEFQIVPRQYAR